MALLQHAQRFSQSSFELALRARRVDVSGVLADLPVAHDAFRIRVCVPVACTPNSFRSPPHIFDSVRFDTRRDASCREIGVGVPMIRPLLFICTMPS